MKTLNYKLFLDDVRHPYDVAVYTNKEIYFKEPWLIVRNFKQFTKTIESYYERFNVLPDVISFDHDLADTHYKEMNLGGDIDYSNLKEKTGYDCAKWLVEFCIDYKLKIPEYMVHSMNPVGKVNILSYLLNADKHI